MTTIFLFLRTPLSSSTSHSGDRLCQSGNLKENNDNLSLPSYRRKYITNKKPGIKPASHFTERCKNPAPACRTRSLHYLTPKVVIFKLYFLVYYLKKLYKLRIIYGSHKLFLSWLTNLIAWGFLWRFTIYWQSDNRPEASTSKRFKDIAQIFALSFFQQRSPFSPNKTFETPSVHQRYFGYRK